MATAPATHRPRLTAVLREEERVTPLELFFDLVFVLAITQCTELMSDHPTWEGLAQGLLVLGVLWWAWVGYSWFTSVVDPEEGAVRGVIFAAMASMLLVALCVPEAFDELALEFAIAYAGVRLAHIGLFLLASRDDPILRQGIVRLAISTALGVGILVGASTVDGLEQAALWALALALDPGGTYLIDPQRWRLVPRHFAERHGLIIIIALGESIVAIGLGVGSGLSLGQAGAAVVGIGLAAALWWMYFDVVALVAARRLERAPAGRVQNAMARDSYSYVHFAMVAGIVLVALGMKKTLGDVDDPLDVVPAFALLGGLASYLLGHVAFRYRHTRTLNRRRALLAALFLALLPVADEISALATLALVTSLAWILIAVETRSYGEGRAMARHEDFAHEAAS